MRQRITIEDENVPSHIFGDPVYEKTSIFQLHFPFAEIRGRLRSEGLLAYMRKGVCITRKYVKPNNPNTPIQLNRQETFKSIQRHWQTLSEEARLAWKAYALKNIPQKPTAVAALAGFNAWVQTQTYRLGMGGQFGVNPPDHGIPSPLVSLVQEAAPDETSYAFRVEHRIAEGQLEGKRLLVEITPAMPSLRRKPQPEDLCWATEDTRCYMELQPCGSVYLLQNARFNVAAGQRYGVRMRIVTTDGVPGPMLSADWIKTISADAWKDLLPVSVPETEPDPEVTPAEVLEMLFSGVSDTDRAQATSTLQQEKRETFGSAASSYNIVEKLSQNGSQNTHGAVSAFAMKNKALLSASIHPPLGSRRE